MQSNDETMAIAIKSSNLRMFEYHTIMLALKFINYPVSFLS